MNKAEWLAERHKFIGGSDVAGIMGGSPYSSALKVYLDKTGQLDPEPENEAMYWGKRLEDDVLDRYAELSGETIRPNTDNTIIYHPKYPFMAATLDAVILDASGNPIGVLEAKTANHFMADKFGIVGTDDIPEQYLWQVHHYMAVTGLKYAKVAVLIGGNDFRVYHADRDEDVVTAIEEACVAFWARVQAKDPPELDETQVEASGKLLRRMYPVDTGQEIEADDDLISWAESLAACRAQVESARRSAAIYENKIKKRMASATKLIGGDFAITWKTGKDTEGVDYQAAFMAVPMKQEKRNELIKSHTGITRKGTRRFTPSGPLFKKEQ